MTSEPDPGGAPSDAPKIYVALGFHTSFYHSWRGDTPDEAGFGLDIRVVRGILRILDEANERGLQARAYWDFDVYWTLQEIIPHHAPDIVGCIRGRVQSGLDEIVLGPFNNGANHAATERELRAAISYAFENPFGSGLRQVFGEVSSILRPQESMYTAGQNAVFLEEGVTGLVLYYAGIPFNAISTFIPPLPPEQRYNPLWLRARPEEPPVVLWPCISPGDLVENVSLEALMLRLRRLQTSGRVRSDLLIHVNFDADSDAWLPFKLPRAFAWFPNTGGLQEYIEVVNRYPWAAFTVPSAYLRDHLPRGEVLVRQDLADGGFDGNYSWAEKWTSLVNWTALERSRLHTYRAEALARRVGEPLASDVRRRLWGGQDGAFFQRLIGLSTTHFGMSTPTINEERQARAEQVLGGACDRAARAERDAALAIRARGRVEGEALYVFELFRPVCEWQGPTGLARAVIRLPIILPPGVVCVGIEAAGGDRIPASLVDPEPLSDGSLSGELLFNIALDPDESRVYRVMSASPEGSMPRPLRRLRNPWLDVSFSEKAGFASFTFEGRQVGAADFLAPFITYRSRRHRREWRPAGYVFEDLDGEAWDGLSRIRMRTRITMETPHGEAVSELRYTLTLFDGLPYLMADVAVDYAATPAEGVIHNAQQKLRQFLDLRWVEVAPFQIRPAMDAPAGRPLRVWKRNYLGVTSWYDLDYGRVNPRNRDMDSFNHQVTAGWVAVSDGQVGLLLAENAEALASMAFCPMRLRERDGIQHLWLNPFGSYFGRQLDYTHLGGNRVGAEFTTAISGSLRPNGPSYNGRSLRFSLLLAPYLGDEPPAALQADAHAYFYPPGVVYLKAPDGLDAKVPGDIRRQVTADRQGRQRVGDTPAPVVSDPARVVSLFSFVPALSPWTLLRLIVHSLVHVVGAGVQRVLGRAK